MHTRRAGILAALLGALFLAGEAAAGEDATLEELTRRNRELEERVEKLERSSLEEDVESYLETVAPAMEGAPSAVTAPGALAVRFSGEVRIRFEVMDRMYGPADPAGAESFNFTHMRTRLRADVQVLAKTKLVIEIQDVRSWGAEGSTTGILAGVDIKRAAMVFEEVGGHPLNVEAGRFVMHYGDQRLIGHLEWADQGRTYDGIRALVKREPWWVDGFFVQVRETLAANDDLWFGGFYGGWEWLEAYVLVLRDEMAMAGETGTGDTLFLTFGFRVARKTGRWDYSLEVPFQLGDLKGDDLQAWGAAFVLGYTFEDAPWRPRVAFELAYASGDGNPADGDVEQLQTLFPTNHVHYGYMDLVGWSNILDFHVSVTVKPSEKTRLTFDVHHFRRPEEQGAWINAAGAVVRPGAPGADGHLGDEFDLVFTWLPAKPVTIEIGYAIFVPGGFVDDTGADPVAHWFYVQGHVKF